MHSKLICMSPICLAIRLVPLWICVSVHFWGGARPSRARTLQRLATYGFSVSSFKRSPVVLLTHMFVHLDDSHLLQNMMALAAVQVNLGGPCPKWSSVKKHAWATIKQTAGALLVMIVGGAIGVGGQLLFLDVKIRQAAYRIVGPPESVRQFLPEGIEDWMNAVIYQAQKLMNSIAHSRHNQVKTNSVICGCSAGVAALVGFGAVYRKTYTSFVCIVPDLLEVVARLQTELASMFDFRVAPDVSVGHAGHVGGFVAGVVMGTFWSFICKNA
ncbi:putative rhomboid-like protein [Trypanosoma vivax]|uniref:Rhomboid-like protein, putative n=1 Tax=Trypanosoma vivax (strain Y486) TaxID=1055687 RepID=F9WL73_TRYVY|nr:putative rhomboid-like protein [Trypanosoma vivax]CCD18260.1 rhomboid-like protein, putative [Trypanosoma vivax Y486]|eukprot:CCD18260.1 rhomboid-like protein, putative [Trypanosoma vivax Y486]